MIGFSKLLTLLRGEPTPFELAVRRELDYLQAVYGQDAPARGIERAERNYISDGRRRVLKEAARRLATGAAAPSLR